MPRSTLQLGRTIVLEAVGGPPDVEYVLFDPGEIELRATEPGTIREVGYRTTVGDARTRLADSGITPTLSAEAVAAARPAVARAYARGPAARAIVERLDAAELFEARSFDAPSGVYQGTWLDLAALASDLQLARAGSLLQCIHLAASLSERAEDEPVILVTEEISALRRPGQRTYRRVNVEGARDVVQAIRALKPMAEREGGETGLCRSHVVQWLRERAEVVPGDRHRLEVLEGALAAREPPARGPLAETTLWKLEEKLSRGDTTGVLEQIDLIERRRGRMPATTYLRERVALMTGTDDPRAIAERASALSASLGNFYELQLLAAQAWTAAGDERRTRAFARDLVSNAMAGDALRIEAAELLQDVGVSSSRLDAAPAASSGRGAQAPEARAASSASPPSHARAEDVAVRASQRTPPQRAAMHSERPPAYSSSPAVAPRHESAPPANDGPSIPRPPLPPTGTDATRGPSARPPSGPPPVAAARPPSASPETPLPGSRSAPPPGTSLPPYRVEPRGERAWSVPPPYAVDVERLETLSLPPGAENEPPPDDARPRTPAAARLTFTYLARELARELRVRHGVDLTSDVDGLEVAQRYLRELLVDGRVRSAEDEREVMRHGAFLSELFARRLAARWADLGPEDPGLWAMLVPCQSRPDEVARVWPFGRVLRFIARGHKERDLVGYFLEIESRAR